MPPLAATCEPGDAKFELVQEIPLPRVGEVVGACADTGRRRICMLFRHTCISFSLNMLMLVVVLDWNDEAIAVVNFRLNDVCGS